jgi:hypothetical protein
MPVRLVADGEAGHIWPVLTPDAPGGLGIDRLQISDRARSRAKQAQRVDNFHPGRGREGKQFVDPGEAIAARARRDQLIHCAPADPQAAQAQITEKGDQRVVCRDENVTRHTRVARIERTPLEAQPSEISRDHRPGMPSINGNRYRMGARPVGTG